MSQFYQPLFCCLGGLPVGKLGLEFDLVRASVAELVGGWSSFFLAWLGLFALFGTLWGIAHSRRDAKRARTLDYLRRFNGEEFAPLNAKVLTFLATADPAVFAAGAAHPRSAAPATKDRVGRAFDALDIETQAHVTLVLNFYEELSSSYRKGLLDEGVAAEMIVPTVAYGWEVAEPFVTYRREQEMKWRPAEVAGDLMRELEALYREKPEATAPDALDRLEGVPARLACVVALALMVGGLVAVAVDAAAQDVPSTIDSFLVAIAAVFAVLAVIALTPSLVRSSSSRSLLLTGAIAGTMAVTVTTGLTIALDLTSSVGPPGAAGKQEPTGVEGVRGPKGERGRKGKRGKQGSRGQAGKRGPVGPAGPRGYPGHLES
jgi:hypothetical protein